MVGIEVVIVLSVAYMASLYIVCRNHAQTIERLIVGQNQSEPIVPVERESGFITRTIDGAKTIVSHFTSDKDLSEEIERRKKEEGQFKQFGMFGGVIQGDIDEMISKEPDWRNL